MSQEKIKPKKEVLLVLKWENKRLSGQLELANAKVEKLEKENKKLEEEIKKLKPKREEEHEVWQRYLNLRDIE